MATSDGKMLQWCPTYLSLMTSCKNEAATVVREVSVEERICELGRRYRFQYVKSERWY